MLLILPILSFVAVLAALIIIHELGHFIAAKLADVKVLEFGIGFPPKVFGVRYGETLYSLNVIPIGGFVRMEGEENPSSTRSLAFKRPIVRFLVMIAGPFMNAIVAVFLFTLLFMLPQNVVVGDVTISEILPNSPAETSGLLPGDVIVELNGSVPDNHTDIIRLIGLNRGVQMDWMVLRDGQVVIVEVRPSARPLSTGGFVGIIVGTLDPTLEKRASSPWAATNHAIERMWEILILTKNELMSWASGGSVPQVTGVVGMGQGFVEIAQIPAQQETNHFFLILGFAAYVSMMLAIFNILPIPALDGGRIMFVILEWLRRGKRVSPRLEGLVHFIGFGILMSLMVVITYNDILRIFRGERLLP